MWNTSRIKISVCNFGRAQNPGNFSGVHTPTYNASADCSTWFTPKQNVLCSPWSDMHSEAGAVDDWMLPNLRVSHHQAKCYSFPQLHPIQNIKSMSYWLHFVSYYLQSTGTLLSSIYHYQPCPICSTKNTYRCGTLYPHSYNCYKNMFIRIFLSLFACNDFRN